MSREQNEIFWGAKQLKRKRNQLVKSCWPTCHVRIRPDSWPDSRQWTIHFFSKWQGNPARYPAGFGPCVLSKFFVSFPSLKAVLLRSSNKDIYKMKTLLHTGRHNLPSLNECRPRHSTCTNQVKNPLDGTQASKQALRIKQHLLV